MDETAIFDVSLLEEANVKLILKEVFEALEERGYQPINQIVGYLMSGDPGYISSYKGARDKIISVDRAKILGYIVSDYLK